MEASVDQERRRAASPAPDDVITSRMCCAPVSFLSGDESTTKSHA